MDSSINEEKILTKNKGPHGVDRCFMRITPLKFPFPSLSTIYVLFTNITRNAYFLQYFATYFTNNSSTTRDVQTSRGRRFMGKISLSTNEGVIEMRSNEGVCIYDVKRALFQYVMCICRSKYDPNFKGDPEDKSLRKVETEVLIPKIVREKARLEKCIEEVAAFSKCGKEYGLSMVFLCRTENATLQNCMSKWFHNEELREACKKQYLQERTEFRATGIMKSKISGS